MKMLASCSKVMVVFIAVISNESNAQSMGLSNVLPIPNPNPTEVDGSRMLKK